MGWVRDWISWCLLAVALACLGLALVPRWDEWVDPATGDRVSERRLGLWFSPIHQTIRREAPNGGFTWQGGPNWISWSSLLAVVGVVCFEAFRARRRAMRGGSKDTVGEAVSPNG
jgi:hypothetical protein